MTTCTTANSRSPPVSFVGLCMQYLLLLRIVTLGSQLAAVAVAHYLLQISPPIVPVAGVIAALSTLTLLGWRNAGLPVSDRAILVQLLVDVFGLTALLLFTGGSVNPFASLLLLPVIVAAAMLRSGYTWLIAATSASCYSVLMFIHVHPLFIHVHPPQWSHVEPSFTVHIWGMWFGFLISAAVVAYFVARMGATLRAHDRELAMSREKSLQANQALALGTLATGTAHELGTPLATMAVLTKEMEHDRQDVPGLTDQLRLLRDQINRCKEILSRMAARAGQARADAGRQLPLDRYLEEVLAEWRDLRPDVSLQVNWSGARPAPRIIADRTLTQAIINVLNNAADASAEAVELDARWDLDRLEIEIRDRGAGLPAALREHIGEPFVTTKSAGQGLGLGLYLARTTLDRLGGHLELSDRATAGVSARIALPLSTLTAVGHA